MLNEKKSICCHDCGHKHPMDTPCPTPKFTGDRSCARRTNELETARKKHGPTEFHHLYATVDEIVEGLWANIRAKQARGEKPARKGSEAYKKAKKAADKINAMDELHTVAHDGPNEFHKPYTAIDYCPQCLAEYITEHWNTLEEAEYKGRKVQLGKPFLTPDGPKKRSVYVKNAKGNVVKVNFGDPNLKIKKNIPARRKSFRARHKCNTAKDRTSPRYWSCKAW